MPEATCQQPDLQPRKLLPSAQGERGTGTPRGPPRAGRGEAHMRAQTSVVQDSGASSHTQHKMLTRRTL